MFRTLRRRQDFFSSRGKPRPVLLRGNICGSTDVAETQRMLRCGTSHNRHDPKSCGFVSRTWNDMAIKT
jgi:hypothetical protein